MIKDLAGSIDNLIHAASLDGGHEIKNGNQNVSVSIEKIEESVEHILDQNESIESELEDLKSDMTSLKTQISSLAVSNFFNLKNFENLFHQCIILRVDNINT